jgi:hypothetical protein
LARSELGVAGLVATPRRCRELLEACNPLLSRLRVGSKAGIGTEGRAHSHLLKSLLQPRGSFWLRQAEVVGLGLVVVL